MMHFHIHESPLDWNAEMSPMYSVAVKLSHPISLTYFLRAADSPTRVHWQNNALSVAYAGYGVAAMINAGGQSRFTDIRAQAESIFGVLSIDTPTRETEPRFFGGFAFQPDALDEPWAAFSAAWFVMPRVMLTQVGHEQWITLTDSLRPDYTATDLHSELIALTACFEAYHRRDSTHTARLIETDYPLSQAAWTHQVTAAVDRIHRGLLEKVVLSRTCDLRFDTAIDPLDTLDRLATRYPETYRFMIAPTETSAFVGATPEVLVEVSGAHIRTAAVAGSVGRGKDAQEDAELAAQLFTNPKERHEHALVAESLRDLLEPITTELRSPEDPYILTLGNIQHLHTPFEGTLGAKTDVLDVVATLHPTPALGGCPQRVAMETITEIEMLSRGWYASPVGWFDRHGSGLFAVAIRSAVLNGSQARLYAGCGIVAQSEPDREWDETRIKFKPMLDALGASL